MHKLSKLLCILTIMFCVLALDVQATASKKNGKSENSAKQKKNAKAERSAKNKEDKKAVASRNAKENSKSKKNDKKKEIAETRQERERKSAEDQHRKEDIAKDTKKNSHKEAQALTRKEKAEKDRQTKKDRREEVAVTKPKANKSSHTKEPEETRPRTVTGSNRSEKIPITSIPAVADKAENLATSESSRQKTKPSVTSPLPAAQNDTIEVIEEKVSGSEAQLVPPTAKSREEATGNKSVRNEEEKATPSPSAKNNAASSTLLKPTDANLQSPAKEVPRFQPPQSQAKGLQPQITTPAVLTLKAPEVRVIPPPIKSDNTKLVPSTGQPNQQSKPEQSSSSQSDEAQQNPSSGNSRYGIAAERVVEIQKALIKQGYLEGEPTAIYDENTKQAMKRFQLANNLSATGLPSAHALKKLGVSKRSNDSYAVPVKSSAQADKKSP